MDSNATMFCFVEPEAGLVEGKISIDGVITLLDSFAVWLILADLGALHEMCRSSGLGTISRCGNIS